MNDKEILETANLISENIPAIPKVIDNFIELTIGNWLEYKNSLSKEKFKYKLKEKISQIPKDKIIEPKLSILGPALEASKYYIEEEEIREMFTNLISASMNSDSSKNIHHSFVEIIKQLSPYDAKLFKSLYDSFPLDMDSEGFCYLHSERFPSERLNTISLNNLKKQGLIEIAKEYSIERTHSDPFTSSLRRNSFHNSLMVPRKEYETIENTYCYITELGKLFKKVCIE